VKHFPENPEPPAPWTRSQPKFERLEYEGPRRFFLVGRLPSGEPLRIRLCAGSYETKSRR
jgi:hypothetical protein